MFSFDVTLLYVTAPKAYERVSSLVFTHALYDFVEIIIHHPRNCRCYDFFHRNTLSKIRNSETAIYPGKGEGGQEIRAWLFSSKTASW